MTNSENMGAKLEECEHLGDSVAQKCCTLYPVLPPLLGMAAETGGQRSQSQRTEDLNIDTS
ncbi:hypothetical protein Bpfe_010092, partial [Biomphalaria pfeifferi]